MTTTEAVTTDRRDVLVEQLFQATIGAQDTLHVYLGDKLGLYDVLAAGDALTPGELAEKAGIASRYAREWLEQQACSGLLDVAADEADPDARRFRMPDGGAEVFCGPDSLFFFAPVAQLVVSLAQTLPQVLEAFKTGGGVPFEEYGEDIRIGIERINKPMFVHQLAQEWIPAMADIEERLRRTDPPARVADLGCGSGWSTLAIAQGYPDALVDGIDLDQASIETAIRKAAEHGLSDRVTFTCRDAADPELTGRYDLVTLFETLHDMAHPVPMLSAARALLADGGAMLIGDERVAETFAAPAPDLDRFNYGWSALHCLAAAMLDEDTAATGTVMRPDTVRRYAAEAGFGNVTVLPIEHDFWWFYRLDP